MSETSNESEPEIYVPYRVAYVDGGEELVGPCSGFHVEHGFIYFYGHGRLITTRNVDQVRGFTPIWEPA